MAKSRKKPQELTETEQPASIPPEAVPQPEAVERQAAHENGHEPGTHAARHQREHAPGFIANPSSKRRESHAEAVRKLPGKLLVKAGDLAVRMIDAGDNRLGIGIKVEVPEGRTLTHEEKDIIRKHVRGEDGEHSGYHWDHDNKMWHKQIVQNFEDPATIPPSRPVAIRLDAERRVEALADALRHHQKGESGHTENIDHRREQAADTRIPG